MTFVKLQKQKKKKRNSIRVQTLTTYKMAYRKAWSSGEGRGPLGPSLPSSPAPWLPPRPASKARGSRGVGRGRSSCTTLTQPRGHLFFLGNTETGGRRLLVFCFVLFSETNMVSSSEAWLRRESGAGIVWNGSWFGPRRSAAERRDGRDAEPAWGRRIWASPLVMDLEDRPGPWRSQPQVPVRAVAPWPAPRGGGSISVLRFREPCL